MFEIAFTQPPEDGQPAATAELLDADAVTEWAHRLRVDERPDGDAARIDLLHALEVLKNVAAAAQAAVTRELDASQRSDQAADGTPAAQQGRGVAKQVGLARRESHHRGRQHLALARTLPEMPHTAAAFSAGQITEWRAQLLLRETACLSLEHRQVVDEELAGDRERLAAMGDREVVAAAMSIAARLDAAAVVKRRRRAEGERTVTVRPAPDTMTYLTGLLPVAQGVAVYAELKRVADRERAAGDARSRGQIMADTLVHRVVSPRQSDGTGTDAGATPVLPLAVTLLVSDRVLFGGADDPAVLPGYGEIPGELARELLRRNLDQGVVTSLRRVYARPESGALVAMDSRSRTFPTLLAQLIELRDGTCRTPWCDAPVRHRDHVQPAEAGGSTAYDNGQGLCEACNYARQASGWDAQPRPGPRHTVVTTTPTGHRYTSVAPRAPTPAGPGHSECERLLLDLVWAA